MQSDDSRDEQQRARQPYSKPVLQSYGSISALTQGGGASGIDGMGMAMGGGMMMGMMM